MSEVGAGSWTGKVEDGDADGDMEEEALDESIPDDQDPLNSNRPLGSLHVEVKDPDQDEGL